mmetsp:Transcript_38556/g.83763  ORF Transcript_38556/g.83763 Transcript_38556/m.83763 type:complete len:103 (-) Transcript_38556:184-492(-)
MQEIVHAKRPQTTGCRHTCAVLPWTGPDVPTMFPLVTSTRTCAPSLLGGKIPTSRSDRPAVLCSQPYYQDATDAMLGRYEVRQQQQRDAAEALIAVKNTKMR